MEYTCVDNISNFWENIRPVDKTEQKPHPRGNPSESGQMLLGCSDASGCPELEAGNRGTEEREAQGSLTGFPSFKVFILFRAFDVPNFLSLSMLN